MEVVWTKEAMQIMVVKFHNLKPYVIIKTVLGKKIIFYKNLSKFNKLIYFRCYG